MALDREKTFANGEKLLKQGRIGPALDEFRRVAEAAPRDVLMLNRIGDVLARAGRNGDAIGYYEKAADHFTQAGFYPKAVAILKKIPKLDPARIDVQVRIADLHAKQKLPGEAKRWFLAAADTYLRGRDFAKAREVYERVVAADPADFLNRVRLAETRAAEGDAGRAAADLVEVAEGLLGENRAEEAERAFRRAAELGPARADAWSGVARALGSLGRGPEALEALATARSQRPDDGALLGEELILLDGMGRAAEAGAILSSEGVDRIPEDCFERLFAAAVARRDVDATWQRVEPALARWRKGGRTDRLVAIFERLAGLEERGWIPALERLCDARREEGARVALSRALERLIRAYRSRGMEDRIPALEAELRAADPRESTPPPAAPREAPPAPVPEAPAPPDANEVPIEAEAPAIPLTSADEEWVAGHLTEAEVFQKYGLAAESLQQLREVTKRFPGHVAAQERLAAALRGGRDAVAVRDALVALALARRAAGDAARAREAADEAAAAAELTPEQRTALEGLGVLEPASAPPPDEPPPAPAPPPEPAERDEEFEIEFDEESAAEVDTPVEAAAAPPPAAPPGKRPREAGRDMLEEIEFYVAQGMFEDARKKIEALRLLGFTGEGLDELEAKAAAPVVEEEAEVEDLSEARLDDDDLSTITAALEAELDLDVSVAPAPPEPETFDEQSLQEVFDAFKQHVAEEVGSEDFRTHYDLGIAYKEMGLIDDAIGEFRASSASPALYRDSCSMLAMCHRERGEWHEAAAWYRKALDTAADEGDPLSGVRYDLAEVLAESGDLGGALDEFTRVLATDPSYRDVRRQVEDLRQRLGR